MVLLWPIPYPSRVLPDKGFPVAGFRGFDFTAISALRPSLGWVPMLKVVTNGYGQRIGSIIAADLFFELQDMQ